MEIKRSRRAEEGFGVWWNLVHLFQGLVVLSLLWNFVAHAVNTLALAVGGPRLLAEVGPRLSGIEFCSCQWNDLGDLTCTGPLPPELCVIAVFCLVVGFLTYIMFKLVCWTEWVKEEITWEECWKEKKWYNPWDWITTVVCVTKKAVQWVLQKICKYLEWVIVIAIVVCIVGAIIAAA